MSWVNFVDDVDDNSDGDNSERETTVEFASGGDFFSPHRRPPPPPPPPLSVKATLPKWARDNATGARIWQFLGMAAATLSRYDANALLTTHDIPPNAEVRDYLVSIVEAETLLTFGRVDNLWRRDTRRKMPPPPPQLFVHVATTAVDALRVDYLTAVRALVAHENRTQTRGGRGYERDWARSGTVVRDAMRALSRTYEWSTALHDFIAR